MRETPQSGGKRAGNVRETPQSGGKHPSLGNLQEAGGKSGKSDAEDKIKPTQLTLWHAPGDWAVAQDCQD